MPANPAFLSRFLCLQIRDGNFCRGRAFRAGAFRRTTSRRCLSQFPAFRRFEIPAGDLEDGGCGYDHLCADRKYVAVVRTSAQRIGRAIAVAESIERDEALLNRESRARCLLTESAA